MALVNKIDSNSTGTRYQEELSLGVPDATNDWIELEPNSYADFGQQITNVARIPIVADRQMKKGVATDLDASGAFNSDLTQENLPDLAQGYFQADLRVKNELVPTNVDGTAEEYDVPAGGDDYLAGDLLFAQNFTNGENNGLKVVTGGAPTAVTVAENLVDEPAPPTTVLLRHVGFQFAAGDLDVDSTGDFVTLTTAVKDMTQLGLLPGEFIFLGGDVSGGSGDQFLTAANNGFKRIRSIAANAMVLDKSDADMATEVSTLETVRMFFAPRMVKNEGDPSLIVRRSYQLERQLGFPDDTFQGLGNDQQAEYLVGAVPSTLQLNIATADKLTMDMSFMGTDMEQVPSAIGSLKAGARPALVESDAFNSSSDVSRINMSIVSSDDEAPAALFPFIQEMSLTVDNNISPNKGVGVFGAFDLTTGKFGVSGTLTAYFADVATQTAVRNNADVTLDFHFVKANQGISVDLPLVTVGDGRPNVEQDAAITLPISFEAATGAKVDPTFDHTMMMLWWDFLPNAADV